MTKIKEHHKSLQADITDLAGFEQLAELLQSLDDRFEISLSGFISTTIRGKTVEFRLGSVSNQPPYDFSFNKTDFEGEEEEFLYDRIIECEAKGLASLYAGLELLGAGVSIHVQCGVKKPAEPPRTIYWIFNEEPTWLTAKILATPKTGIPGFCIRTPFVNKSLIEAGMTVEPLDGNSGSVPAKFFLIPEETPGPLTRALRELQIGHLSREIFGGRKIGASDQDWNQLVSWISEFPARQTTIRRFHEHSEWVPQDNPDLLLEELKQLETEMIDYHAHDYARKVDEMAKVYSTILDRAADARAGVIKTGSTDFFYTFVALAATVAGLSVANWSSTELLLWAAFSISFAFAVGASINILAHIFTIVESFQGDKDLLQSSNFASRRFSPQSIQKSMQFFVISAGVSHCMTLLPLAITVGALLYEQFGIGIGILDNGILAGVIVASVCTLSYQRLGYRLRRLIKPALHAEPDEF